MPGNSAITTFAYWNKGPFMPYYSAQPQSPFFRLPREIRDLIYKHYVFRPDSYCYDPQSRKMHEIHPTLRSVWSRPISMSLMLTCRAAAAEMKGLAFRLNVITFHATRSDDGREFSCVKSRAGRFKCRTSLASLFRTNGG